MSGGLTLPLAIAFHLFAAPLCVFSFSTTGVVEKVNFCIGDLAKARAERTAPEMKRSMSRGGALRCWIRCCSELEGPTTAVKKDEISSGSKRASRRRHMKQHKRSTRIITRQFVGSCFLSWHQPMQSMPGLYEERQDSMSR